MYARDRATISLPTFHEFFDFEVYDKIVPLHTVPLHCTGVIRDIKINLHYCVFTMKNDKKNALKKPRPVQCAG